MIQEDLYNIQRLCFKYGKVDLAEWASQSLELYCTHPKDFYSHLEPLHWWSHISTLRSLILCAPQGSIPQAECKADNKSLQRSLQSICGVMTREGYENLPVRKTPGGES